MRHLVRFCLILAALPALAEAQSKPLEGFDAYVSKAVKDWHAPGLAIAVVHDDSVVFIKGYGTRTVRKNEPVDEHTRFACASTTRRCTVFDPTSSTPSRMGPSLPGAPRPRLAPCPKSHRRRSRSTSPASGWSSPIRPIPGIGCART